jgi:hypothetical protein
LGCCGGGLSESKSVRDVLDANHGDDVLLVVDAMNGDAANICMTSPEGLVVAAAAKKAGGLTGTGFTK